MSVTPQRALQQYASPERAAVSKCFFKTGPGEYGEGDQFIGVTVPDTRKVARAFVHLTLPEIKELLKSPIHEERLLALLILVEQFTRGDEKTETKIFKFYCEHLKLVNNWDLVDLSAAKIIGAYLMDKPRDLLTKLAASKNIWERRVAIVATYYFIKHNQFADTLKVAEILLRDRHDLIQKAVGWMLREVGKRSLEIEEIFLRKYYTTMPRMMLRYAIEKFPEVKRQKYLKGL